MSETSKKTQGDEAATFDTGHAALRRALELRGYATPTPVQAKVLEAGADGRDLLVSAQTGSGKTVAFGLALAGGLLGEAMRFPPTNKKPSALVIAPTRELALQVGRELGWLYAETGARVVSCVGGMDIGPERRALFAGANIVVGTPGRLCDHLTRGGLDLAELRAVVLDEADEMLDLGFREELEKLLGAAPKERQTLLFSATLPREIVSLAKAFQKDAIRLELAGANRPHGDISYRALPIAPGEREHAVVNVLREADATGALVFCATRDGVTHLHASLLERGFSAVALSGELSQAERTRALQALRDGRARVCVATDVAARGLDLPDLGLVIHADLPTDAQVLLHRSGRTGRAGRKGTAVLLVPFPRRRVAENLIRNAGVRATFEPPPSAEQIRTRDAERLVQAITALAEEPDKDDLALGQRLLETVSADVIAATLVRVQRSQLPAPEDLPMSLAPRPERSERPAFSPRGRAQGATFTRGPARPLSQSDLVTSETGAVWFRIDVGREENADPRWLVPLLCRRGGITKAQIGKIRVMMHETRFEIAPDSAERFAGAACRPQRSGPNIDAVRRPTERYERPEGPRAYGDRAQAARAQAPRPHAAAAEKALAERPRAAAERPHASRPAPRPHAARSAPPSRDGGHRPPKRKS